MLLIVALFVSLGWSAQAFGTLELLSFGNSDSSCSGVPLQGPTFTVQVPVAPTTTSPFCWNVAIESVFVASYSISFLSTTTMTGITYLGSTTCSGSQTLGFILPVNTCYETGQGAFEIIRFIPAASDTETAQTSFAGGPPLPVRTAYAGVEYLIAVRGIFPSRNKREISNRPFPFVGEIIPGLFKEVPSTSFMFCHGQILNLTNETIELFSVLGNKFGGDGVATFGLPDLRGRWPVGAEAENVGKIQGGTRYLTDAFLPSHFHTTNGGETGSTPPSSPLAISLASTLGLTMLINPYGVFPGPSSPGLAQRRFIGEVMIFAGDFTIAGWLPCKGTQVSIFTYTDLFNFVGCSFGGDCSSGSFTLPDLRGRTGVQTDTLFPFTSLRGSPSITLSADNLPAHVHTYDGGFAITGATGSAVPSAISIIPPQLSLSYIVAAQGYISPDPRINPNEYDGRPIIGQMLQVAWSPIFEAPGWLAVNGSPVNSASYPLLAAVLQGTFGNTNVTSTFALPNFSGRVVQGGSASFGTTGGAASIVLSASSMPSHSHALSNKSEPPAFKRCSPVQPCPSGFQCRRHAHSQDCLAGSAPLPDEYFCVPQ